MLRGLIDRGLVYLSGATDRSDVWSVGCTVIELFTGAPPYSELGQVPALFRIVQDVHPPLQDGQRPGAARLPDALLPEGPARTCRRAVALGAPLAARDARLLGREAADVVDLAELRDNEELAADA